MLAEILFQPYYFIVSYRQLSSGQGYQLRSGIAKKPASPVGFFASVPPPRTAVLSLPLNISC
ncbi:hypothetical protein ERW21_01085 [Shigella sonnei]|uniref:Uncharacterized protein n=3 Tax=Enterobacteriaceae TaxID=543 RepID=G4VU87_ECOLX|nr:hypothetical protein [Escherichia coli]AXC59716.1 hypothetical protein B5690_27505 [Shigella flexneri 2a]EAA0448128.1 hypothetical protein [Shigella sonnei]EAA0829766.1 hypothetical protein [Shigella flexneri]EAA1148602.1 hypothetical protein [Shigella boydii]EAA3733527.1 hypothetical protein [Salmonella enterica subsp. enterica serovar Durham]EAA6135756.1 hypothetical protein [Salmonella enterica]EAA6207377.1 hypothetical protein [Salmonella enterica subsp. enterica serovar Typhimurium]